MGKVKDYYCEGEGIVVENAASKLKTINNSFKELYIELELLNNTVKNIRNRPVAQHEDVDVVDLFYCAEDVMSNLPNVIYNYASSIASARRELTEALL